MKNDLLILFLISIISISTRAQNNNINITKELNNSNAKFIAPPGTIKMNDNLYIDVTLVDNLMYHEFLDRLKSFWSLKASDSIKKIPKFGLNKKDFDLVNNWPWTDLLLYTSMLPVSDLMVGKKLVMKKYFEYPKFNYYPIVNISKEQAQMYCKWRTDMVMILWAIKSKDNDQRKKYPNNIRYRLPNTNELNEALLKFGYSIKQKKVETPFSPYRSIYQLNKNKAVFLKNNISEYTIDGPPFGTNWRDENVFTSINDYTGFRCVCEIIE